MTKTHTKKQSEAIFEKSMAAFGLHKDLKTDPLIMQDIIKELKLADFKTKNKRMEKFFKDIVSKPQKLQPMFENIKKGIISKHPAIVEFADLALRKRWFGQSEYIIRSVHVMYVLEALTAAMCNSHNFFIELQDHYKTKEQEHNINSTHLASSFLRAVGISHELFGTIKYLSVDPAMIYFRTQRNLVDAKLKNGEAEKLFKEKKINHLEYKLLLRNLSYANELLRINIYEAGVTEYKKGFVVNAISAFELSENIRINPPRTLFKRKSVIPENNTNIFYKSIVQKDYLFPVFEFSQEWVSLYITWNMAFILSDLSDLDLIFPNLLIPSIINTESENFIGARAISLWLTLNHVLFRKCDRKKISGPAEKTEMAKAWGKINQKYAFNLAKRETHEDSKELMKGCNSFFSHPIFNLFKLVKIFLD
ncbi:MAG: hypothetical protein NTY33_03675 [Candidatus Moranbacteria bacterium]|nr:hypothetical protein [Candidatus Moranbacteria bacterium]